MAEPGSGRFPARAGSGSSGVTRRRFRTILTGMSDDLTFYTNPMSRGRIARWMLEEVGRP